MLVQAGSATLKGTITTGRSRVRCESGQLTIELGDRLERHRPRRRAAGQGELERRPHRQGRRGGAGQRFGPARRRRGDGLGDHQGRMPRRSAMSVEPKYRPPSDCPVCGDDLVTTRLGCRDCGTELAGEFAHCDFCALEDAGRRTAAGVPAPPGATCARSRSTSGCPTRRRGPASRHLLMKLGLAGEAEPITAMTREQVLARWPPGAVAGRGRRGDRPARPRLNQ